MFKKPKNRAKSRVAIRRKQQARSDSDSDGEGGGDTNAAHNNNAAHDAAHDLSVKKEEEKEGTDALGSGNGDAPEDKKEEEESSTTLDRILQTKKRRKLKNALLRQGGVGAAAAKKRRIADHPIKDEGEGDDAGNNDTNDNARDALVSGGGSCDLRQRLQGTFGGGNDGSSSAVDGEGAGEGVLGQKHRAAMDKYIQERMDSTNGKDGRDGTQDKAGADRQLLLDEDALYRQVAAEVGVAGMVQDQAAIGTAAPAEASATADNKTTTKEDDVGAGGMMLAGTGIAEVALPVDERIRTVRETELLASSATAGTSRGRGRDRMVVGASMAHAHPSNDRSAGSAGGPSMNDRDLQAMLPTSFGGGKKNKKQGLDRTQDIAGMAVPQTTAATAASAAPGRKPPVASSAGAAVLPTDVADLSQSYSHNFKLHTHQWVADRKTEQQREVDRVRKEQEERDGTVENRARVGFEQARRVARGGEMAGGGGSGGGGSGGVGGGSGSHVTTGGMAGGGGDRNRSSDDRVWRSFVSKQRNRR